MIGKQYGNMNDKDEHQQTIKPSQNPHRPRCIAPAGLEDRQEPHVNGKRTMKQQSQTIKITSLPSREDLPAVVKLNILNHLPLCGQPDCALRSQRNKQSCAYAIRRRET